MREPPQYVSRVTHFLIDLLFSALELRSWWFHLECVCVCVCVWGGGGGEGWGFVWLCWCVWGGWGGGGVGVWDVERECSGVFCSEGVGMRVVVCFSRSGGSTEKRAGVLCVCACSF